MLGVCHFIFNKIFNEKIFTVTVVPPTFLGLAEEKKLIIFRAEKNIKDFFFQTHINFQVTMCAFQKVFFCISVIKKTKIIF